MQRFRLDDTRARRIYHCELPSTVTTPSVLRVVSQQSQRKLGYPALRITHGLPVLRRLMLSVCRDLTTDVAPVSVPYEMYHTRGRRRE